MPGARRQEYESTDDRRHHHPPAQPEPLPQDMSDDYYHYYMASQKRVSRWINQTQKELETATPMPVPSLFDVSMGPSAIRESLAGERRGAERGQSSKKEGAKDANGGLKSTSTSTLVASSSSRTRASEEESPESRRRRKEKERERERLSGETKERRKHHDSHDYHDPKEERLSRRKSRVDHIIEEDGPRRASERHGNKRTSSMSPPPSTFKPATKGNALDLFFAAEPDTTIGMETVTATASEFVGSAGDLARVRRKEETGKEREREKERERVREKEREREREREKEELRERERRKAAALSSSLSPQKSSRSKASRGRSDTLAAQDVLERRELDRQKAGFRSRSRVTGTSSKRSHKPSSSSSGGFDLSSTSFQALLVLLSGSMLMIAVAPKVGAFMSVSVVVVMLVVMNM